MSLISGLFKQKKPLDKVSLSDFRIMLAELEFQKDTFLSELAVIDNEIEKLRKKVNTAENEIDKSFSIQQLNSSYAKKESVLNNLQKTENEHRAISNLLFIKEHEKVLKSGGVWSKLKKIDTDSLMYWLADSQIQSKNQDEFMCEIISLTEKAMTNKTALSPDFPNKISDAVENEEKTISDSNTGINKKVDFE